LAIHFIFPSEKQASSVRTVDDHHPQATFCEFVQAMQNYRGLDIQFVFYAPSNCSHSADFLFVLKWEASHQYTLAINWKKIKKKILFECRSAISNSTLWQATGNYANNDDCSSQNSANSNESITGHATPAMMKPKTKVPEIIDFFVTLTS
jgi:hypothetical protein